jgi:hypothetical protein
MVHTFLTELREIRLNRMNGHKPEHYDEAAESVRHLMRRAGLEAPGLDAPGNDDGDGADDGDDGDDDGDEHWNGEKRAAISRNVALAMSAARAVADEEARMR